MRKYVNKVLVAVLCTITLLGTMFTNSVQVSAISVSEYEQKLNSLIDTYGIENIVVENGVSLDIGSSLNLEEYYEQAYESWIEENETIVSIDGNTVTAMERGSTFVLTNIEGKTHILEVVVSDPKAMSYSFIQKGTTVNRNYYKVFIDPGHGGADPGAVANGVKEADLNLSISLKVQQKLKSKNVDVAMSRTTDATVALEDRPVMANNYGADVFVSIHQNSFTSSGAYGIETYHHKDKSQDKPYATKIQNALISNTGAYNRGVKTANFLVNRETNMPSALVECGFITNVNEVNNLKSDSYQEKIANAIADSIYNYLVENIQLNYIVDGVNYRTHIEDYSWQSWRANGQTSGTMGQAKRIEGIEIKTQGLPAGTNIAYRVHVQENGWQGWKRNGEMAGTEGQSKRIEAIEIKLEGAPLGYDVEYRTYLQDYGWQAWKRNGQMAGTEGQQKRIEAIEVKVVQKEVKTQITDFISSIYNVALGRTPDNEGLSYWYNQLSNRQCGGRWILINLLSEPEFKNLNLGAEDFVNKMYTVIVGRAPDTEGFKYWVDMYNDYIDNRGNSVASTRMAILSMMINEPEFRSRCERIGIDY